jgi:RNA polymerase sigma factor (sigma-70 family)
MTDVDFSKNFFLRLNEGRESAMDDLDRRYRQQLCALVEREMGKRFAAREDPEDAVQSAMASFCRGVREQRFVIDSGGKLWGLLATIARHKMLKHIEAHDSGKRSPDKEEVRAGNILPSGEPSVEDALYVAEVIEKAMYGLKPPDPQIFRLRLEGFTRQEIAEQLGLTEASVKTRLERIRERLNRCMHP